MPEKRPTIGRPAIMEDRRRINVYLSAEEKETLERLAARLGVSISGFVRDTILNSKDYRYQVYMDIESNTK